MNLQKEKAALFLWQNISFPAVLTYWLYCPKKIKYEQSCLVQWSLCA